MASEMTRESWLLEFGDGRYWVFSAINFSMRTFEILPGRADQEKVQTHKSP